VFVEEERQTRRRWRSDLDEVAVAAAVETFRRSWPAFEAWWTGEAEQLPPEEREIPPEPFESALRTYLEQSGR
jgi:hypothetical protein